MMRALHLAAQLVVVLADALYIADPSTVAGIVAARHLLSTVETLMEARK
jgi:hypothetical protein